MALSPNVLKYAQKMLSVDKEVDKAALSHRVSLRKFRLSFTSMISGSYSHP